ncbi:twin-arginine translocation signal domain-containing protein [Nonomuraea cavernae]|uniref:DUF4439 domain-containing protein n=1 Tax=Nonomuraea cavernae TaxID=2045107 RepID=A0A917Z9R5_9ACTN|nr:twin-arginine translocation signal domain-containing protein [Nonomuraea cavernae]MCA2189343.1 twin-arginine translocation signal domain-containing protein [Nonomuraea cavernae]GGO77056.1 hypothetical protein GCM10012289_55840 [Nonomuraea cavernae]
MRPSLSRRAVLAGAAAAAALAGCSTTTGAPPTSPPPEPPERVLARQLIAEKEATIALYSTLIADGGARLTPFRDRHQAHLSELRRRFPGVPAASATPSATPSAAPSATAAPKVTLSRLRTLERRAAALRTRQLTGVPPAMAQLVASIGACEAAHAVALPRSL